MATKKCPKCGEENPAEAVMCWACYTPLAGGAAAVAGGGLVTPRGGAAAVTPAATAAAQDAEKTSVDPKIFAVVGLLIAAALIGSFTTGLIGGSSAGSVPEITPMPGDEGEIPFVDQPVPAPPPVQAPVFTPPTNTGGGDTQAAVAPQFKTIVAPDPRQPTGTMGIILNTPNVSPTQALALARFAKQRFEPGGRWSGMQVVVFSDPAAAKTFLKYQAQRKGARLTPKEYQDLADQGVWNSVPVYYETRGKTEMPYRPSANPKGWWTGARR